VESGSANLTIPDDAAQTVTSSVSVSEEYSDVIMESVAVHLDLNHGSRGDLQIDLVSPSGTISRLARAERPENTQLSEGETWTLSTVRNWGEAPVGEWRLEISDMKEGDMGNCTNFAFFHAQFIEGQGTVVLTCDVVDANELCVNGAVRPGITGLDEVSSTVDFGDGLIPVLDACCTCGGGQKIVLPEINALKSWRMKFYGHIPITEAGVASGGGNATGGNATDGVAVARAIPSKSAAPTSSTTMLKSSSPASEPSTESLMSPSDFPSNAGVPGQPTFCMHSSLVSCFFHFLY